MTQRIDTLDLLDVADQLAALGNWSAPVYRDLLDLQAGRMARDEFDLRYRHRKAVLNLDITAFTTITMTHGEVASFLLILETQETCVPVLRESGATLVRAFADDLVALFDNPAHAVEAALRIHERLGQRAAQSRPGTLTAECAIGVGYGDLYAIGPNLAMGDEMNRAAKLGEDTAQAGETLVTESVFRHLERTPGLHFERKASDGLAFPYYSVRRL